jgi:phenylalanyl-tRNA synthetase beta chain
LRVHGGVDRPEYPFFTRKAATGAGAGNKDSGKYRVFVDPALKDIRPFIAAFVISGKPIDDLMLKDVIQTQEKLCWNFGRKRRSIAMGVYRSSLISWPVRYVAADPDDTKFVPLGMEQELSLREICEKHQKGLEYGHIVAGFKKFPYIMDDAGGTLSFPPVINSARIGAVEVGDEDLFVEMTGTDLESLTLAVNMVACDFADAGFDIIPVRVDYPYETPFGRSVVFPYYFQEPTFCPLSRVHRFLGEKLTADECLQAIERMGCKAEKTSGPGEVPLALLNKTDGVAEAPIEAGILVYPAEYRNDYLHAADVVEDVMIGRCMKNFAPLAPRDFTIGRLTPITYLSRKVKESLIGLGYQEMIYNYLGSGKDFVERMNLDGSRSVRISNPMSENFEYVRDSVLPCLMMSESVSGNAVYPHRIFEVGKVAYRDEKENYGVRTRQHLGFLHADRDANFNVVSSQLQALFYYLSREYVVEEVTDPRFIPGRSASILFKGEKIGIFGELHPSLLDNWGVTMPCTAAEVDLDSLL